ncbi:MAG: molybdopterin-dependent oxidoreductase [Spirochaetales bacterium]|nr:molybdopterin-dependent oxidoreductase [Spirochaetales bacterium]
METYPVSCNKDCGGGCPLIAYSEKGRVVRIKNNPLGAPRLKGCKRGLQAMQMDQHPQRLTKPLIRLENRPRSFRDVESAASDFREADWEEALDLAASRMKSFKDKYGCQSLIDLSSGGACRGKMHNNSSLTSRFLTLWGGALRTRGSYSSEAVSFVMPYMFGTKFTGSDAATLQYSNLIILWGYNAFDTRFGAEMVPRIKEARKRGVPVIVIDPRKTRTAEHLGSWWIPIRPGTDTALMAAVLYYLMRNDLIDHGFIDTYSYGFSELKAYVMGETDGIPKDPEWASRICAVPARDIEKLADLYGRTSPAALLPGLSLQRARGGEEAGRMPVALQLATGNIGIPGGSSGGAFWGKSPGIPCPSFPVPPHDDPTIPVYEWPDQILEKNIRGAYITGGNLVAQGSDIRKNIRAFQNLDLAIGHDFFLTPTMALCDIVFPPASFLEREDIVKPEGHFLLYSAKAAQAPEGVLTDYEIFSQISRRMGFEEAYTEGKTAADWIDCFLKQSAVGDQEAFKRDGIFMGENQERVAFSDFIANPSLSPLATPSGKIEIASRKYEELGFDGWPHYRGELPDDPDFPLMLITPHPLHGTHSQNANIEGFRLEEDRVLWMNPTDAGKRGVGKGTEVYIRSPQGEMKIPVLITDKIMAGTVSLNEGLWPVLSADGTLDSGGSANMLSSTEPTLPSRGARTHTIFVQVSL